MRLSWWKLFILSAAFTALALSGCDNPADKRSGDTLSSYAGRLNESLKSVRWAALRIRDFGTELSSNQEKFSSPPYPKRQYDIYQNKLVFAKEADGRSSIMSTGATLPGPDSLARLKRLEHLEPLLKKEVSQNPLISMAWYATDESFGVFHPPFDMVAMIPPGLDIPSNILPYIRAVTDNPGSGPVWTEPYVDITGKGYMITVAAPQAKGGNRAKVEAVAGCDITLLPLVRDFGNKEFGERMLLSRDRYVVAVGENLRRDLGFEALGEIYYLRQVEKDVPAPEKFQLTSHPNMGVVDFAKNLDALGESAELRLPSGVFTMRIAAIPENGWLLLERVVK